MPHSSLKVNSRLDPLFDPLSSVVRGFLRTNVIAAGGDGQLFQYNGTSWSTSVPDLTAVYRGLWFASETDVYIAGGTRPPGPKGTIWRRQGASLSTSHQTTDATGFAAIWRAAADDIFAVGVTPSTFPVAHLGPSGWSSVTDPVLGTVLTAVWGTSGGEVFATGFGGGIFHFDGAWTQMATPNQSSLNGIDGTGIDDAGGRDVFVVGDAGTIWRYRD